MFPRTVVCLGEHGVKFETEKYSFSRSIIIIGSHGDIVIIIQVVEKKKYNINIHRYSIRFEVKNL